MPRNVLTSHMLHRLVPFAAAFAAAACSGPKQCPEGLEKDTAKSKQLEIWCRSKDGKIASWTELQPDGKGRRQTCNYSAGAAEGSYFAWYTNGKVWIEGVYRGGEKAGKWAQFTEAGDLTAKGEYRFGRFVAGAPVGRMALCEDMKP